MIDAISALAEVDRIAALGDPVIRNLQITQCYHELSAALAERTGPNANWCTFATWASKQAGQTIRKEDLARTLENALDTVPAATQAAGNVAVSAQRIGAKRDTDEIQESVWDVLNSASERIGLKYASSIRLLAGSWNIAQREPASSSIPHGSATRCARSRSTAASRSPTAKAMIGKRAGAGF